MPVRTNAILKLLMFALILVSITACWSDEPDPPAQQSPDADTSNVDIRAVTATDRTAPLDSDHDLDEPALWVNPNDASESVIVATDKANGNLELAGLRTYNLDGTPLQELTGFFSNNVDILSGFPLSGEKIDLVTTVDRTSDNQRILFFRMDSEPGSESYRHLLDVSGSNLELDFEAYGQALFHDRESDQWHVFVSQRREPLHILQFRIEEGTGEDAGKVVLASTEPVRTIEYRPSNDGTERTPLTLVEGMRVDQDAGTLLVGEEEFGLLRYGAKADDGHLGEIIDTVAKEGGRILPDVEGVTIIETNSTNGYIVVSGQNKGELSRFEVYDRQSNEHLHSFVIAPSSPSLPAAIGTDGIHGYYGYLNDNYPIGVFIAHSDNDSGNASSLLIVGLHNIWPEDAVSDR